MSKPARRNAVLTDGELAEARLREISDEVVRLRKHLNEYPGNQLLIDLLEMERGTILEHYGPTALEAAPNRKVIK